MPTNNEAAGIVNQILKDLIENAGGDAAESVLIAEYPFLGLPFIKQIFEFILSKVTSYIYTAAANAATKIIIDIQINEEESTANNAFSNLQLALASGDSYAIQKASDDLDMAYRALITYDGSSPA